MNKIRLWSRAYICGSHNMHPKVSRYRERWIVEIKRTCAATAMGGDAVLAWSSSHSEYVCVCGEGLRVELCVGTGFHVCAGTFDHEV